MTKKILAILFLLPTILFATESRVATLGGESMFLLDNTNIQLYPGLVSSYPNTIFAEIKQPMQFTGLIKIKKIGVLGFGVTSDTMAGVINHSINHAPFIRPENPSNVEFYYGKSSLGIKMENRNYHYEDKLKGNTHYLNLVKGSLGAKYNYASNLYIDIAVSAMKFYLESRINYPDLLVYKAKNDLSYGGNVRFVQTFTGKPDVFILGVNYEQYDIGCTKSNKDTTNLLSQNITLFSSANYYPVSNILIVAGFQTGILKDDEEIEDTVFASTLVSPGIILGIENNLNKWLTVRLGVKENWGFLKTDKEIQDIIKDPNELINSNDFELNLGCSVRFNNFVLDVICNDLLFTNPVTGLSASYEF